MLNLFRFLLPVLFISTTILSVGQSFELSSDNLLPLYGGKIQWADLDNDHDLDLIYSGFQFEVTDGFATQVYENSNGSFILRATNLPHLRNGTIALGDYDKDGDLDILLSGLKNFEEGITHLYENTGNFSFSLAKTFPGLFNSTTSWVDLDNDEDLDFLVSGMFYYNDEDGNGIEGIKLYVFENIDGDFFEVENHGIKSLTQGSMDWADRNGDGKIDLAIIGLDSDFLPVTEIYLNNGNKTFRKDESENFPDLYNGDVKWGDFDNDGDADVLLTGYLYPEFIPTTEVYENTGNGWKKLDNVNPIQIGGSYFGGIKWVDFDNDGYLDFLLAGGNSEPYFFKLYKNNGANNFIEVGDLDGIAGSSVDFGDYDNDGDVDLCFMGNTTTGSATGIYKNTLLDEPLAANAQPIAPNVNSFSEANYFRKELTLSWSAGSDAQTPAQGLSYNFYIRNEALTIVAPPSNLTTGYVLTHSSPNGQAKRAILRDIPEGTTHWAVQSIDGSKWGSSFSSEKTFYQINGPETVKAEIIDLENIKLSWIDNSSIETSYQIARSSELLTGYSSVATLQANTDSYIDNTNFLTDTYYYYRIHAENTTKASGYDSLRVLLPTPPTNLLAQSVNASKISLTWEDQSEYENGYRIERKLSTDVDFETVTTLEAGTELFTDTGLSEGTSYDYRVLVINEYGAISGSQNSAQTNFKPAGQNFGVATLEDLVMPLSGQDFINAFSDPDAGDELVEILIATLPEKGTLKLSGNAVTAGQIISVAALGTLTFAPLQNENGITSFNFYNNDGKDNSSSSYTVTLTITPVNDAPTLTIIGDVEIEEGTAIPPITFSVEDVDDPIASLAILVFSNNQLLIQDSKITVQGATSEKTIQLLSEEGSAGEALITLSASDATQTTSTQFRLTVIPVTGLSEIESYRIKIYPNPFTSFLTVSLKETAQPNCIFVIRDLLGRIVVSQYIKEKESTFDLRGVSNGMYTISITDTKGNFVFHTTLVK